MNKVIQIAIILTILIGCEQKSSNFLLDEFPDLITNSWEDKSVLKSFKETPFEAAITKYPEFQKSFNESSNKFVQLEKFAIQYKESLKFNNLDYWDSSNSFLLFAMYHKIINQEKFEIIELKKTTDLLYVKHQILHQDNIQIEEDENCYIQQLSTINKWLKDSLHKINYIDADLILGASNRTCESNTEYSELYNETLYNYLKYKPHEIIELLEEGTYNTMALKVISQNLRNPLNDEIEFKRILENLNRLNPSNTRNQIIDAIKIAVNKYE